MNKVKISAQKIFVTAGVVLLLLLVLCYAALHIVVRAEWLRVRLQSELSQRTGYEIQIGGLRLQPWLTFVVSAISVSKDGRALFEADEVAGAIGPIDLLQGRIRRLSLNKPVIRLPLQELFKTSGGASPQISFSALNIEDGEFVLETERGQAFALRSLFLSAKDVSLGGTAGLQLRAYLPQLGGTASLSLSGSVAAMQAEILIAQAEAKSPSRFLEKAEEKAVLDARFQMSLKETGKYEVNGSGNVNGLSLGGNEAIAGKFTSWLELDAKLQEALFSLDLETPGFPSRLLPAPLAVGAVKAQVSAHYSAAVKTLAVKQIAITSAVGALEGQAAVSLAETPAKISGDLRLREVALDSLKPLMPDPLRGATYNGKIAADFKLAGPYNDPAVTGLAWSDGAKIGGERFSLSSLAMKAPFQWTGAGLKIKAAELRGKELSFGKKGETQVKADRVSVTSDAAKAGGAPMEISAGFEIADGRFANPEGTRIGEHLNAKGRLIFSQRDGAAFVKGETRIESLELLWGSFFGDFKEQKPAIEVDGRYRAAAGELTLDRLRITLASAGSVELKGRLQHLPDDPAFNLEVRSDDLHHAGFYDFFIKDTFKIGYPILGQIGATGRSSFTLSAQGSLGSFTVDGNLRLAESVIQEKGGSWRVGPIELNLPLKLRFPEALKASSSEAAPVGKLTIQQIQTQSTKIPAIGTPIVLWNNSLRFPEPVQLSLFGGAGLIEDLAWRDIIGAPRDMGLSLRLDGLRLSDLTETLGWYRFNGTLSGSIPGVRWIGDSLKSDGTITLNAFGGKISVRGMEIEQPLSPGRSIKMAAKLEGLNLEQASETFQFGHISGVLAGAIDGLVLSQGQAAAFNVDLQTVAQRGVGQRISVEALNNLTVISSGNDGGSVFGGIASFFDSFRYSKLGFKAALKNDTLLLRGVETSEGKEYLVVGSWLPPTVNIVSYTQEISFSELLRRLERIQKTGGAQSAQP